MSTVLAYDNGDYKILMTDTKESNTQCTCVQKMHYIENLGFIAGIGIGNLVQNVFIDFSANQNLEDLCNLCGAKYNSIYNKIPCENISEQQKNATQALLNVSSVTIITNQGVYVMQGGKPTLCNSIKGKNKIIIQKPYGLLDNVLKELEQMEAKNQKREIQQALLEMLDGFKIVSNSSTTVSNICCIGIIGFKKKPFYIEGEIEYLIDTIKSTSISKIKNQFNQCKNKLINWNSVNASEEFNNKLEIYPVNDTYNQN